MSKLSHMSRVAKVMVVGATLVSMTMTMVGFLGVAYIITARTQPSPRFERRRDGSFALKNDGHPPMFLHSIDVVDTQGNVIRSVCAPRVHYEEMDPFKFGDTETRVQTVTSAIKNPWSCFKTTEVHDLERD